MPRLLDRFVPVICRGLALGFAVLAVATALFGMGDHATAADRYLTAALYGAIAVVGFVIALNAKRMLRLLLSRD